MKILIINPNTSSKVTEYIRKEAIKYEDDQLKIEVIKASNGPKAIETYYDEIIASTVVLKELKRFEGTYDAAIIACFSDPGLPAAKELYDVPIVGICEASVHMSNLYGNRFSVVATGGHLDISIFIEIIRKYGLEQRLASVRYMDVGVEGVSIDIKENIKGVINKCRYEDGAENIILGCGAFSGFGNMLTEEMKILVIDGIEQSIAFAKMMAENNYKKRIK